MATGFTQSELDALMHAMDSEVPGIPRRADKILADPVNAMRVAGTEKGALFAFEFKGGATEQFWLHVWVAKELAAACNGAALEFEWQRALTPEPSDHIREPRIEDIDDAAQVISLATNADRDGMLVRFAIGQRRSRSRTLYLPVRAALTVLSSIATGAATAEWWDPETFDLIPSPESQN